MPSEFTGIWTNQNGSILDLTIDGTSVTGRFESGVGADGHKLWVEISGKAIGGAIAFTAIFEPYGTVAAWVGHLCAETETLKTQWLHASNVSDAREHEWMWFANRIGADEFRRC